MEHNNVKLQNDGNNVETWCNYIFHGLSSIHADTNNFNCWVAIDFEHFVQLSNQIGKPIREVIGYHRIQGLSDDRELPEGLDSNTNMLISTPIAPTMPAEPGSNSSSTSKLKLFVSAWILDKPWNIVAPCFNVVSVVL
jgi:hypothetical protein